MKSEELELLHPALKDLLSKLSKQKYSLLDCAPERLSWFFAGCPIWPSTNAKAPGVGRYTVVCTRDSESWLVYAAGMPECSSFGRTLDEAMKGIREALGFFFDDAETAELIQDIRYEALDG